MADKKDRDAVTPDSLGRYMRDVSRTPLLTAEEELLLQKRLVETREPVLELEGRLEEFAWNDETRAELQQTLSEVRKPFDEVVSKYMTHNLRLVVSIAKKISKKRSGVDLEDRVQEGNFGLRRAVEKFDPDRGCTLATYATWWIKQSIFRSLNRKGNLIYFPDYLYTLLHRLRKAEVLEASENGKVTEEKIAERMEISMAKLAQLRDIQLMRSSVSLDAPVDADGEGVALMEQFADSEMVLPDSESVGNQMQEVLQEASKCLTKREQYVMEERVLRGRTLKEIGEDLKITRERVRQIQNIAREKLARALRIRALQEKE